MYICIDCGKVYDDYEVETVEELPYGERHCGLGAPLYGTHTVEIDDECACGGEIVKATKCKKCGDWTPKGYDLCRDCAENYKNLDTMLEIGADWNEDISLNGFLMSAFTKDEIEQILIDTLKNGEKEKLDKAINKYCEDDVEYFWGYADKKWKEEK